MKKNKIFAIIAILAITISGVLVFQACKKNETNTTPTTENSKPMPFAVKNLKTGEIVYNVTAEKLQSEMENRNLFKGNDRYIIESLQITNVSSKGDENEFIKCSIIDTETETASNNFLSNDFFAKEITDDFVYYYIDDEVMSGKFSMSVIGSECTYVCVVDNFTVNDSYVLPDNAPRPPRYVVQCSPRNCRLGDCVPVFDMNSQPIGCLPCSGQGNPEGGPAICDWTLIPITGGGISAGDILGLIGLIISIIK